MKICLISREYPWRKPYGGVGVSTAVLARALSRQGHSVSVLTQSPSGTRMEVEEDGLRVIGLPLPPMRALPRRLARFSAIEAAAWSCRVADAFRRGDLRPDVVEAPAMNGEALQLLKLRNRPPVVVRIRGGASLGLKTRGLFRWYHVPIYRRERRSVVLADRVAALSEQALRENAVHFRLALDSAIVLPNPVDTTVFTPSANRPKTPVSFLFVGRLDAVKGFDLMPSIATILARQVPGIRFTFAGADRRVSRAIPAMATAYYRSHASPDAAACSEFLGVVPVEDMPGLYRSHHVLLAPSRTDAGPRSCIEAAACGMPVVGARETGMGTHVVDGETGFLVSGHRPEAFAERALALARDRELRQRMGRAARRRAETLYSLEAIAQRCLQCYRELILP